MTITTEFTNYIHNTVFLNIRYIRNNKKNTINDLHDIILVITGFN